jgi:hypothetical protein
MMVQERFDPLTPDRVQVYPEMPPYSRRIAMIMVRSSGSGQRSMDRALEKTKQRAAKLGASGICLQLVNTSTTVYQWYPVKETYVTFEAFTVSDSQ